MSMSFQNPRSFSINRPARSSYQDYINDTLYNLKITESISIGLDPSKQMYQQTCCISIGKDAGLTYQGTLGDSVDESYVGTRGESIAIGCEAGKTSQYARCIAIGAKAGYESQGLDNSPTGPDFDNFGAIAIGHKAGLSVQRSESIAIGFQAGYTNQGVEDEFNSARGGGYAIGFRAGYQEQTRRSVAIGSYAGNENQGNTSGADCVAIGTYAGQVNQSNNSIAISWKAGRYDQEKNCIAIGYYAGNQNQGSGPIGGSSIAIGRYAAEEYQQDFCIAMGANAGQVDQQRYGIAIGSSAGQVNQQSNAIAIGTNAGNSSQGYDSVSIGQDAGLQNQQYRSIAIGYQAGAFNQGITEEATGGNCIAIGTQAGENSQGDFSIAIGAYAGINSQADSSIILNASSNTLDASNSGLFVDPVTQRDTNEEYYTMHYRPLTKEVIYGLSNASTPGIIQMFAGTSAPNGFLLCDGSAVSRTGVFANLFAVIGTTYGIGDGVNTFNVPNLQGRVPVGRDAAQTEFDGLGETGGAKTHTLTVDEMPAHTHSYFNQPNTHEVAVSLTTTGTADNVDVNQTTGSTGGSQAHNNLQPYIVLNYIIT